MLEVKDRVTQYTDVYKVTQINGEEGVYQITAVPGTVVEKGTPINRALFQSIWSDIRVPAQFYGRPIMLCGAQTVVVNRDTPIADITFSQAYDPNGQSAQTHITVPPHASKVILTMQGIMVGTEKFTSFDARLALLKNGAEIAAAQPSAPITSGSSRYFFMQMYGAFDVSPGDQLHLRLHTPSDGGAGLSEGGILRADFVEWEGL